jgi:hypothetical protein
VEFLSNEFDLAPGAIAFLYSRRWEEQKFSDTWKNYFSLAKAWGAGVAAIENQVRLAIVTSLLVALLAHGRMGQTRKHCASRAGGRPPSQTGPIAPAGALRNSATPPR